MRIFLFLISFFFWNSAVKAAEPHLQSFDDYFKGSKLGSVQTKESQGFKVSWVNPRDGIFVEALLEHLEKADRDLAPLFRDSSGIHAKVPVEIFPDLRTFSDVSGLPLARFKATGTIALTLDQRLMILSPRNLATGYNWAVTAVHEYTHYLIRTISPELIPIWLHEGTAQIFQGYPYDKSASLRPQQWGLFKKYKEKKKLLSLEALREPFPMKKDPEEAELAYAQSLLFTQWLDKKCGIVNLIRNIQTKKNLETPLGECAGKSFSHLSADFIPQIMSQIVVPKGKDVAFFAKDFSGSDPLEVESRQTNRKAKNFAQLSNELFKQGRFKSSTFEMEKALQTETTAPPSWRRQLALAYKKSNQSDRGDRMLEKVLTDYPEDAAAWYLLGISRLDQKKTAEAWTAFVHAFFVNPYLEGLDENMKGLREANPRLQYSL